MGYTNQGCDGHGDVESQCALYGNPTSCCSVGITKMICADSFSTMPTDADFQDCDEECNRATPTEPEATTTPAPTTPTDNEASNAGPISIAASAVCAVLLV